jgi:hypothetical protein
MTDNNAHKPKGSFAKLMSSHSALPKPSDTNANSLQPPDKQTPSQSTGQSTSQSIDRSVDPSTNKSTNRSVGNLQAFPSSIVDRPKAFYITERLDKDIDSAVRYFQEVHGIRKADRSTVVNAILDNEENWTPQSLDRLVDRLISQLTNRLTNK